MIVSLFALMVSSMRSQGTKKRNKECVNQLTYGRLSVDDVQFRECHTPSIEIIIASVTWTSAIKLL